VAKNGNGTFKQLHIKNKVVPLFRCHEAGERCPVHILDLYFSRLPEEAFTKDIFFFRALEKVPSDPTSPWYSGSVPVGKNTLHQKLSKMCALAGIEERVTNHSLQATSAPYFKLSLLQQSHLLLAVETPTITCLFEIELVLYSPLP